MIDKDLYAPVIVAPTWIDIEKAIKLLSDDRIKQNTDYSVMLKYHDITVTTRVIYCAQVEEAFAYYGLKISNIFTF